MEVCNYEDFEKIFLISGTILEILDFPRAKNPSYKVKVDFGEKYGIKWSSAQVVNNYTKEKLIGKKVIGCINLGERNIAGFKSEFLLCGFKDNNGNVSLPELSENINNGEKLH